MARLSSSMRRCLPLLLLSVSPLVTLLWSGMVPPPFAAESIPAAGSPVAAHNLEWQGVASCASTACHGGNGPKGSKGSEYTTWVLEDRHTKAYQVLLEDRSRLIEKNLRRISNLKDARAETDQLCLRCHAMNADNGPQRDLFARTDGIGCESCHGAAQEWLGLHYGRDWNAKTDAEKRALGFQPLKSLTERAQLCVSCHVGDSDKQVNHDLIAAGHPRLNFEFGAFQAIMPKHWREADENAQPDFEARAWAVGQVISAQAALALLKHRAGSTTSPWPEFAEYDCFACHHDLRDPNWRQEPGHYAKRTPGTFVWGTWYYPMLSQALRGPAGQADTQVQKLLEELNTEMQKPSPDRKRVTDQAGRASAELARFREGLERKRFDRGAVEQEFESIRKDDAKVATANWDGAAQVYLALAALYNALGDMNQGHRDPAQREMLKAWAKRLEFPKGYDSPRGFEPKSDGALREQAPR